MKTVVAIREERTIDQAGDIREPNKVKHQNHPISIRCPTPLLRRKPAASPQIAQQLRMLVQQPEQVDDRRQRRCFAALVAGERIMSPAGQAGGGDLAQTQFEPDAFDLLALSLAGAQDKFVACCRVTPRTSIRGQTPESPKVLSTTMAYLFHLA